MLASRANLRFTRRVGDTARAPKKQEREFPDREDLRGSNEETLFFCPNNGVHLRANIAVYHVTLWWHTLIELWAWKKPQRVLTDRSASPWDDPTRRPSHADRRNAMRRQCLENELQHAGTASGISRKIRRLCQRLLKLVA